MMSFVTAVLTAVVLAWLVSLSGTRPAEAAFPGSNGAIAFDRYGTGSSFDIYSLRPGESEARQLTFTASLHEQTPKWSPDGTRIIFVRDAVGGEYNAGIYVMDANGTGMRAVEDGPDTETDPSWSPDGQKVIYVKQTNNISNIYTVNLDGTGETKITDNTSVYVSFDDPACSPDGTKIAYSRANFSVSLSDDDTYVANANGSGAVRISPNQRGHFSYSGWEPGWSPEGTKIAFFESLHFENTSGAYGNQEIYTANPDGSGLTNLTRTTAEAYDQDEMAPTWSPDGTKIAFVSGNASNFTDKDRINYMNPNGSGREAGLALPGGSDSNVDLDWGVAPVDTAGPTISSPKPAPGASTRDRTPVIRAKIRDNLTRLIESDIELYVDGKAKSRSAFGYYPDDDALIYSSSRLSYGRHTVKIVARDTAGNQATESWRFRVVR